jgi:FtsH-binding integral membrane protein
MKAGSAVALSAVLAFIANYIGFYMGIIPALVGMFAMIAVNIWVGKRIQTISHTAMNCVLYGEAAFFGFLLASVFTQYSTMAITMAFLTSVLFFAVLTIIGFTIKADLTKISVIATAGILVLIVVEVAMLLFKVPIPWMIMSAISLVLFSIVTVKDAKMVKTLQDSSSSLDVTNYSTFIALSLYLDFVNIFLDILQLLGGGGRR